MNGKELAQLVKDGNHPVVTFKSPIQDKEGYLEAGMRGRFVAISDEHDDVIRLHVELAEFDNFNRQFESTNYYDKNGTACLTAREAGYYKDTKESIYVGVDEDIDFCEIEATSRLGLYEIYRAAAVECSYVQWLEDRVLAGAPALRGAD